MRQYGLLSATDIGLIERGLRLAHERFPEGPLHILEIGTHAGQTARGIRDMVCDELGRAIVYYGVDSQRDLPSQAPFPGAKLVVGESTEVFVELPDTGFHFGLIDGCHCVVHAASDFVNYGAKIGPGGILAFHDMNPAAQGKPGDYQGHGPAHPFFGTSVREALRRVGLLDPERRSDWKLIAQEWDHQNWGGVGLFERVL